MATTNLHLARINGQHVTEADLTIGLVVDFPSGMGGTIRCTCTELTDEKATFTPVNKEFPAWAGYIVKFNQPDFTPSDFLALRDAIKSFSTFGATVTKEAYKLIARAEALGYAHSISHTQVAWSDLGHERYTQALSK